MTFLERRRAPRINESLELAYSALKESEVSQAIKHVGRGGISPYFPTPMDNQPPTTVNISATGIAFATNHIFNKNDAVAISLLLDRSQPTIHIIGEVVEFLSDPEEMTGYVRINFLHIGQYDQLRLTNYINGYLKTGPAFKSIS
jgi:hypothetical protein